MMIAAAVLTACSSGSPGGSSSGTGAPALSLLFVQRAASGTMTEVPGGGAYDLLLQGVDRRTTWFSDRPDRLTGSQATGAVVDEWAALGFKDDPPNAALVLEDEPGAANAHIVELRDPVYDRSAATLRYRATTLERARDGLDFARERRRADVPAAFTSVSLFIDDASVPASVTADGAVTGSPVAPSTDSAGGTAPAPADGTTVGLCSFAGPVPKPTVGPDGAPEERPQGPGTMGGASSSPTLAAAYRQFNTMSCTHYQHTYSETPASGVYYYDCVGFTGYSVRTATPTAWKSLVAATKLRPGYVPSPQAFQGFFAGLPTAPQPGWEAVTTAPAIRPGDVLAWITNTTTEAGHSVMALSTPTPIAAGEATHGALPPGGSAYALIVMDSTATPHGPADTRHSANPLSARNAPLGTGDVEFDGSPDPISAGSSTAPSGLGIGTIGLVTDASGAVTGIVWSLGTAIEPVPFGAGRPIS